MKRITLTLLFIFLTNAWSNAKADGAARCDDIHKKFIETSDLFIAQKCEYVDTCSKEIVEDYYYYRRELRKCIDLAAKKYQGK